jgi:hypothetical protein
LLSGDTQYDNNRALSSQVTYFDRPDAHGPAQELKKCGICNSKLIQHY